jgi:hypothetical protein
MASQTLSSLRDLSRYGGVEVIVSDNSMDIEKDKILSAWDSPGYRYLKADSEDMGSNWRLALSKANGEFSCFVSDDDVLVALPGFDPRGMAGEGNMMGIRPSMALFTEANGIYSLSNFEITSARAVDRIKEYFKKNNGANTTLFSAWRTERLKSVYLDCLPLHPTGGGYGDWAIVLALLSEGPIYVHPQLLYVYNNKNWSTSEDISRNVIRTFTDVGMPSDCAQILPILQALECFALVGRANSSLAFDEKLEAVHFCVNVYLDSFRAQFSDLRAQETLTPIRRRLVNHVLTQAVTEVDRLAACFLIAEGWREGLGESYRRYIEAVIDPLIFERYLA